MALPGQSLLSLRAFVFYLGIGLCAVVIAPLAILLWPLPLRVRYPLVRCWNRFAIWWLGITCRLRHRISGWENVPGDRQPLIVFCKHQSAWETIALPQLLPPQVMVFKRELLFIPFFGWGLATLDPIVLNRSARQQALRILLDEGRKRLARGLWITLFPEGTRIAPGTKGRYNAGGAMLAAATGVPVLPIAHNAGVFWPRRSFGKRPGVIDVEFGPLIPSAGRTAREIIRDAETWIEAHSQVLHARAVNAADGNVV